MLYYNVQYVIKSWRPLRKTEESDPIVLEKNILWNIFGPVNDEKTGEWIMRRNKKPGGLLLKEIILG